MRSVPLLSVAILALCAAAPAARSQSYEIVDPFVTRQDPNYGGGFIEMLMTGRDPSPRGARYNRPREMSAYGHSRHVVPPDAYIEPYEDPFFDEPRPRRRSMAALGRPAEPVRAIERVIEPRFQRQEVAYEGRHAPGTIVIDTSRRFLFLVQPGGRALRYGIGVGRDGFGWTGTHRVSRKAEWPSWTPPAAMLKRRPDLPRFMKGGPENPMGARALYLGSTLYRIHGTNEPHTIGQAVSSGCFRMTNADVVDLYRRVPVGARVVVI